MTKFEEKKKTIENKINKLKNDLNYEKRCEQDKILNKDYLLFKKFGNKNISLSLNDLKDNLLVLDDNVSNIRLEMLNQIINNQDRFVFFADSKHMFNSAFNLIKETKTETFIIDHRVTFKLSRQRAFDLIMTLFDFKSIELEKATQYTIAKSLWTEFAPNNIQFSISDIEDLIIELDKIKNKLYAYELIKALKKLTPFLLTDYSSQFDFARIINDSEDNILLLSEDERFTLLFYLIIYLYKFDNLGDKILDGDKYIFKNHYYNPTTRFRFYFSPNSDKIDFNNTYFDLFLNQIKTAFSDFIYRPDMSLKRFILYSDKNNENICKDVKHFIYLKDEKIQYIKK